MRQLRPFSREQLGRGRSCLATLEAITARLEFGGLSQLFQIAAAKHDGSAGATLGGNLPSTTSSALLSVVTVWTVSKTTQAL